MPAFEKHNVLQKRACSHEKIYVSVET